MKHVPRHWIALSNGPDFPFYIHDVDLSKKFEASGHVPPSPICKLISDDREGHDQEAIAHLIAAAPDMFCALERCLSALRAHEAGNCEAAKEARAAIAKARGEK